MIKNILIIAVLATLTCLAISCKGNKSASKKKTNQDCEFTATVMDYKGLSGCSYLLKLEDGKFINPNSGIDREVLMKSEIVKISYTPVEMMSNCMKGTIADITCFTVVKEGEPLKAKI